MSNAQTVSIRRAMLGVLLVLLAADSLAQTEGPVASTGTYKVGVVNRRALMDKYEKGKADWAALVKEANGVQADLDARLDGLRKRKEECDKKAGGLSDEARAKMVDEINRDIRRLQADAEIRQKELDDKRSRLLRKATESAQAVIDAIGKEKGYHLILNADEGRGVVAYFASAVDITSAVLERLNGAAVTATPAPKDGSAEKPGRNVGESKSKGEKKTGI
jgi:Skp family chaperone for outer membrane proteins